MNALSLKNNWFEVQGYWRITHRLRGIYGIYFKLRSQDVRHGNTRVSADHAPKSPQTLLIRTWEGLQFLNLLLTYPAFTSSKAKPYTPKPCHLLLSLQFACWVKLIILSFIRNTIMSKWMWSWPTLIHKKHTRQFFCTVNMPLFHCLWVASFCMKPIYPGASFLVILYRWHSRFTLKTQTHCCDSCMCQQNKALSFCHF